jgi:hypothetical protein
MRLHHGPPPTVADFHPDTEGWTALKEPTPLWLNLIATPVAIATAAALVFAWGSVKVDEPTAQATWWRLYGPFVGLAFLIPVHELIHAVAYPRFGLTSDVLIGVWPSKLLCYAVTTAAVWRNQILLVYLLPFALLSLLPLVICRTFGIVSPFWFVISVVNGLASAGDLVCMALIAWQVPREAVVRNRGWNTWWLRPI